jgi:acyl-coenzyme A thioesterase PaaI-like protein
MPSAAAYRGVPVPLFAHRLKLLTMSAPPVLKPSELQRILDAAFPDNCQTVTAVFDHGVRMCRATRARDGRPGAVAPTVSGPTLMMLADTCAWMAVMSRVGPVVLAVTTSLHMDFLKKPSLGQDLVAEGRILKMGKVLSVVSVTIRSAGSEDVVAASQVTYSLPPAVRAAL